MTNQPGPVFGEHHARRQAFTPSGTTKRELPPNGVGMARTTVDSFFPRFTVEFEGYVPFMYLDRHEPDGLVTVGVGNLRDPYGPSTYNLPWKRPDGSLAAESEIRQAWETVKAAQDRKQNGGGTFGDLTNLRLSKEDVTKIVEEQYHQNDSTLRAYFPNFQAWPADAQLAAHSMAWAQGAGFSAKFPRFTAAVNRTIPDFDAAAEESHMQGIGIEGRNATNKLMFQTAAKVLRSGLDPNAIYYNRGQGNGGIQPSNAVAGLSTKLGKGPIGTLAVLAGLAGAGGLAYAWSKGIFS